MVQNYYKTWDHTKKGLERLEKTRSATAADG